MGKMPAGRGAGLVRRIGTAESSRACLSGLMASGISQRCRMKAATGEQVAVNCVVFSNGQWKSMQHLLQDETRSGTVPP